MGPMRAACRFARSLESSGLLDQTARVRTDLYGSLALTGIGHGTDRAILLGMAGNEPSAIDPAAIESTVAAIRASRRLELAGKRGIEFDEPRDLIFHRDQMFPPEARTRHPNGLRLTAFDAGGSVLIVNTYFSVGGGFIVEDGMDGNAADESEVRLPYPFHSAAELLEVARTNALSIDRVMLANECERLRALDSAIDPTIDIDGSTEAIEGRVHSGIGKIWQTMQACAERGMAAEGILPGGLNVRRRAHRLAERLRAREANGQQGDPLAPLDWVTVFAMAVNEENAAGGRVVTAPTNGAAGVTSRSRAFIIGASFPIRTIEGICPLLFSLRQRSERSTRRTRRSAARKSGVRAK